jgi:predicted AlkP superfamily pyrophosphatase or phosphodiesterase
MLNLASLKKVNGARFSQRFVRPCYDSYCFSNLPATIQLLLTGEGQTALPTDVFGDLPTRYDTVIFFFIDAFGWRFFERYAEKYDILKTFLQHGMVSKLTSQFPSTTAAHVTCIHTGLDVGQSGIYEWNYYEPLIDDIISPLMFS